MRDIISFFNVLSERLWDENYLSDVTYSLLKTNSKFKDIFFEFCFKEKPDNIDLIEREYKKGENRPDFRFVNTINKKEYILEIKIDNKNIHKKYKKAFNKSKLSFIANYNANGNPYNADKIYDYVNTWNNFIIYYQNKIKNIKNNKLLFGYLTYLKNIINYMEAKSMNLSKTKSLIDFNNLLERIIKEYPGNVLSINNNKNAYGKDHFGKYIKYKKAKKIIEFWFGIYWDNPDWLPFVTIEYGKFEGKPKGKYYYTEGEDTQWLYLNDDLNEKLNKEKINKKEQEKIILNILIEFISEI